MNMFIATLLSPLIGGVLLGIIRNPELAAKLNILTGLTTFLFSILLSMQVVGHDAVDAMGNWFHLDAYNVFLVALTAFVGHDNDDFLTSVYAARTGKTDA